MSEVEGCWTERPECTDKHTIGWDMAREGGWRERRGPFHQHWELLRGNWIERSTCTEDHHPQSKDQENPSGWRYRGEGYDHEHWEPFPVELEPSREEIVKSLEEPQRVNATVTISDGTEVHVTGSPAIVAHMLHSIADVYLEEAQR